MPTLNEIRERLAKANLWKFSEYDKDFVKKDIQFLLDEMERKEVALKYYAEQFKDGHHGNPARMALTPRGEGEKK